MRALRSRPITSRPDPAPSRFAYRLQRLLLTPLFHKMVRIGVPVAIVAAITGWVVSQPDLRAEIQAQAMEWRAYMEQRPEFMVHMLAVEGGSPELVAEIREVLPVELPISSFDIDLEALQDVIADLDAVEHVDLSIQAGGILEATIVERVPAAVWQTRASLVLLDAKGHPVGPVEARAAHAKLPLLVGPGADRAVAEGLSLLEIARPIAAKVVGLQRIGERRWDVVLTGNQRILLPEDDPAQALSRAMVMDSVEDMLARDVSVLDMRLADRPTLRLRPDALDSLWTIRQLDYDRGDQ